MKIAIERIVKEITKRLATPSNKVTHSGIKQDQDMQSWRQENGDKTYRLNYGLNENSIVFDIGGYEGQWASDIFNKYVCYIHVFEPVHQFAQSIKNRFSHNPKIFVYEFGLSSDNQKTNISISKDSSSVFKQSNNQEEIFLVKASEFINVNNIKLIDLMKINIEGGEYDLLEHLIDAALIKKIKNIQIQFHNFIPNAEKRMQKIQGELIKTHYLTYQYKFVWENWKLR